MVQVGFQACGFAPGQAQEQQEISTGSKFGPFGPRKYYLGLLQPFNNVARVGSSHSKTIARGPNLALFHISFFPYNTSTYIYLKFQSLKSFMRKTWKIKWSFLIQYILYTFIKSRPKIVTSKLSWQKKIELYIHCYLIFFLVLLRSN